MCIRDRTYLSEQTNDFIQFKIELLLKESNGDPIKKAQTVRDIVSSISKIPDAKHLSLAISASVLKLKDL